MTTFNLWDALRHLGFCADDIKYLHQLSNCCQCRSRCKLIHLRLNNSHNCQWGCAVAVIILLMRKEKLFTLHWHSSSGCSRECVSVHIHYQDSQYNKHRQRCIKFNILHISLEYQNSTWYRNTWKREPEIVSKGSSQSWHKPRLHVSRSRCGPPESSAWCFATVLELIWTIYMVDTLTHC